MPLVESPEEFKQGVEQIKGFCSEINRDPGELDFTVFEILNQWKSRDAIKQMAAAGANRIVLWLNGVETEELISELDELAAIAF